MALPVYCSKTERIGYWGHLLFCTLVFLFLIAPILIIVPLSFNATPYFTFTEGMLNLDPDAYSVRWYADMFTNSQWLSALKNSTLIAVCATLVATVLGTLAAMGLAANNVPFRNTIMAFLISPMIVPVIISAAAMYFFYTRLDLSQTFIGIVLAHAALGTPFVVITVTATLSGFDHSLVRAAYSLGASPVYTFRHVTFPLIRPGMISGGLFAFGTSFDEVVVALFITGVEQRTVPRQMWSGIREQISPTILAVASLLILMSVMLLLTLEMLRRRNARIRGITE
ncbi:MULTISPECIES: ABC transporter permease [Vibrio]|uniref:ABC transporter permease n=1 Tax=Vibrio TaxID=662 RepID=UPI0001B93DEB|nr:MULTISPECIES: ABC transporter permease [Vibrio]EEX32964.1 probable permease of ABC transporter [Vibrio coralliilyticus ATCC BAA-450]MCM5510399.1 ABC transporter permease [Vibrio sp. SCSIO 43169]MDE3900046.1 ABC transporter permease [Vibrio sp. CC007]QFT38737.1 Inner membrane ABC transporter permease protein YdcV [Vibrio sp. THAF64]QGM36725.1 Inner membrane ABC transporter permease protein YdcV [Vibrio sp. THAF191d]